MSCDSELNGLTHSHEGSDIGHLKEFCQQTQKGCLALENSRHFSTSLLVSPRNDDVLSRGNRLWRRQMTAVFSG